MSDPRAIIIAPEMLAAALIDPLTRVALECWRDGEFKAVLNRELLVEYLKILQELGVSPKLMRRWTYWFTSPDRSVFLSETEVRPGSPRELCERLAGRQNARVLCGTRPSGATAKNWIAVKEFLQQNGKVPAIKR